MNLPHPLGILAQSPEKLAEALERVDPQFVLEGLERARAKTREGMEAIRLRLRLGMTELDARKLAIEVFASMGIKKHWHQPFIRFGRGTTLTFNDPLSEHRLEVDTPYSIDLGPVWADVELGLEYEGDYGDTFVFGTNPEAQRCADIARALFTEAQAAWKTHRLTGEQIYSLIERRASEAGYDLLEDVDGHRVAEFPHHKYTKGGLAQVPFIPKESRWVLEVQLADKARRFGAFFEDLL